MSALLTIDNVSKDFGGVSAVNGVSLSVPDGAIYSLIGPNGAGKTTLFNLVSALLRPSKGSITFAGHALHRARTHQMAQLGIGRTFQNLAVFKHLTVVQNLLVGMHHRLKGGVFGGGLFWGPVRHEEIEARRQVEEIIDFLEMEHLRDTPVGILSYGQQKRVELGRALAVQPRLLLLDEMVSGMNSEETEDIARFILDIRDELGITVMMVEHDMEIVMGISDRVAVLNHGVLIAEGPPSDVARDPQVIEAYMGRR